MPETALAKARRLLTLALRAPDDPRALPADLHPLLLVDLLDALDVLPTRELKVVLDGVPRAFLVGLLDTIEEAQRLAARRPASET